MGKVDKEGSGKWEEEEITFNVVINASTEETDAHNKGGNVISAKDL